ncbi:MAG: SDR family oxidoreductase [Candidatus Omnitrophota bacterium]
MHNKKTFFLTGATGLLGSYLLRIFLQAGHKVYVTSRSNNKESAEKRIFRVLNFWDRRILKFHQDNLVILEAEITKPYLGLNRKNRKLLAGQIDETFHCAAVTNLNWPLDKIRQVNVLGTKNVLDLALEWKKKGRLLKVNHISTAYIYGDYKGIFKEDDLNVGQHFPTTYQQSKFEAEKVVNKYRRLKLWIDIYRPPIITGHSRTGRILEFKNIYQLLYLCHLEILDSLPVLRFSARLNPVDSVAKAIYLISSNTAERNKNYHLFSGQQVPIKNIISVGARIANFKKPKVISLAKFNLDELTPIQKIILKQNILSIDFNNKLKSDYTCRILQKIGFSFPKINDKLLANSMKYFIKKI